MKITMLEKKTQKQAAAVAAAAFFDYPMMQHYFPNVRKRKRALPWYMEKTLACAMRYGEAVITEDCSGVMFTLPPENVRLTEAQYIKSGFLFAPLVIGLKNFRKSEACETFVADTHERLMKGCKHYYLWGLVTKPAAQGTGVGAALLKTLTAKADAENMPVYLETHDQRNVAYYNRFGFELVDSMSIPGCELDLWCMAREPSVQQ